MWCGIEDDDAIVDQLVDEVMARMRPLSMLDPGLLDAVDVDAVRVAVRNVARRLADPSPDGQRAQMQLLEVLWSYPGQGRSAPGWWWSTPLGAALRSRMIRLSTTPIGKRSA